MKEEAEALRARMLAEEPEIWTVEGQQSNVRLRRAFHDTLGVDQAIFIFCDDLLERVYELPWLESWRNEVEPIFKALGIQMNQVVRCLLARLPPGKTIPAHHDTGLWSTRTHRVHVPLVTSSQDGDEDKEVIFKVGQTEKSLVRIPFVEDIAVELNNRAKHFVTNNWDQYRVHMIFDYVEPEVAAVLPRLVLHPGQTVVQTRRAIFMDDAAVQALHHLLAEEQLTDDSSNALDNEERVRRSKLLARLWKKNNSSADSLHDLQFLSRRFADGECTAVEYLIFLEKGLGKAGVIEAFGPEVDVPMLVTDTERRSALRAAMDARRQVPGIFTLIGSMKCGTTSLYEYIAQHPDVIRARQKEPHALDWRWEALQSWTPNEETAKLAEKIMDHRLASLNPNGAEEAALDRPLAEKYMNIFNMSEVLERVDAGDFVVTGEATPSYMLGGVELAQRLRRAVPDARLIVILRDPVERAYSHFQMTQDMNGTPDQIRRRGVVADKTFEDLIEEDLARLERTGTLNGDLESVDLEDFEKDYLAQAPMTHGGHSYIGRGFYALQIECWLKVFPREQFLFLRLDSLAANTQAEMNRVFRFLGLPPATIADTKAKNARKYEPMSAETRERLEKIYAPHNARLVKLLGKEFLF